MQELNYSLFFNNSKGNPEPEITWSKDNEPLKDDYRIDIYSDRSARYMQICDARSTDAGLYTLNAQNKVNSIKVSSKVTVKQNPNKLKRPLIEGLYQYGTRFFFLACI